MEYTTEQRRAIALAKARKRKAEHEAKLAAQEEAKPMTAEDHILAIPGMKPISEFAAAANRSIFEFLDFIGPDNINAVMELAGSESRVPTFSENLASDGGYMEPGTSRDAVQSAGQLLPAAAAMAPVTGRNIATMKGAAEEILGLGSAKVVEPVKAATSVITETLPSKAKEQAKLPLYRNSGDVAAAGFKLDDAGKVVNDEVQKKAIKAGVDKGMVSMVSSADKPTKKRMKQMLDVIEKGKNNLEYRHFHSPQKIVGQALEDRLRVIQGANSEAAKQLDAVANKLKDKPVKVSPAINKFLNDLETEGIVVDLQNGSLDFSDSSIEGLKQAQNIIKRVFQRLYHTKDPTQDAYKVHQAKRFIDAQVSYGRSQAGLSGSMEHIVKDLRHNLDGALDDTFPEYDAVNSMYSETRAVIDELQSLAGSKVDLTTSNVGKALGAMSRKVLSNYSSGAAIESLFSKLDGVARRYSSPLETAVDDDLLKLVSAEAEMRNMFPTAIKPNTFQGEIGTEVLRGATEVATGNASINPVKIAANAAKKAKSVFSGDEDAKLQALKELLKD